MRFTLAVAITEAQAHAAPGDTPLTVMTFNIRADFDFGAATNKPNAWISTTGQHRRDLAASVIQDAGPDVLGVQEAFVNQVNDLSSALPGYGFYGVGRNDGAALGEYSGIFYRSDRFTRTGEGTFWLSNTPAVVGSVFPGASTARIASWVELNDRLTGQPLFVLNTHWDHVSQAAREHSAGLIRERLDALPVGLPVIVMGDLNVNEDNAAFTALADAAADGHALRDSYREVFPVRGIREGTFNGFTGASFGARIDHIFHSDALVAQSAAIVRTDFAGRFPSDHYPVTATLGYVPEPGAAVLLLAALPAVGCRVRRP